MKTSPTSNTTAISVSSPSNIDALLVLIREPAKTSFAAIMAPQTTDESTPTLKESTISSSSATTPFRYIAPAPSKSQELAIIPTPKKSRKRVAQEEEGVEGVPMKKRRCPKTKNSTDGSVTKRVPKSKKAAKDESASEEKIKLTPDVWLRIAELSSPKMYVTIQLLSRDIYWRIRRYEKQVNNGQIIESFPGIPRSFASLRIEQYNNLLGSGKGCLAEGCGNKTAVKTYWPFKRRWCYDCWKSKNIKAIDAERRIRDQGIPQEDITAMLATLPFGIKDSYNKSHQTLLGELPPQGAPRLSRIHLTEAVDDLISSWNREVGPVHVDDLQLTSQQNLAAKTARDQAHIVYTTRLIELAKSNESFMKSVVEIEEKIRLSNEPKKTAMAELRDRKKAVFKAKAEVDFPDISWEAIISHDGFKGFMRVRSQPTKDVSFEKSWGRLKKKLQEDVEALKSKSLVTAPGYTHSRSATPSSRSSSAALQSMSLTPDPTPSFTRNGGFSYYNNDDYFHAVGDLPPQYSFGTNPRTTGTTATGFANDTNPISAGNTTSGFDNSNTLTLRPIRNTVSSSGNVKNLRFTGGDLQQYLPAPGNAVSSQSFDNSYHPSTYSIHNNGSSSSHLRLPRASEMDATFQAQPNFQGHSQNQRHFPQRSTPDSRQEPRSYGGGS